MISHHQKVNGRIMQINGAGDRLRGQENSAPCQPNRQSTTHVLHWHRFFISSLKMRGGGVWALITMAILKFQRSKAVSIKTKRTFRDGPGERNSNDARSYQPV
jgi:hypothetical protein